MLIRLEILKKLKAMLSEDNKDVSLILDKQGCTPESGYAVTDCYLIQPHMQFLYGETNPLHLSTATRRFFEGDDDLIEAWRDGDGDMWVATGILFEELADAVAFIEDTQFTFDDITNLSTGQPADWDDLES